MEVIIIIILSFYPFVIAAAYQHATKKAILRAQAKQSLIDQHRFDSEDSESAKSTKQTVQKVTLSFNPEPEFPDTEKLPGYETRYTSILRENVEYYKRHDTYIKNSRWLIRNCALLIEQNHRITLAYDEIVPMLNRLDISDINALKALIKDVMSIYKQNRIDAISYLQHFYHNRQSTKKNDVSAKMKDLVADNDKIIVKLEEFCNTIRKYLAKIYHDDHPMHLVDFTSLELLSQATEHIERAMAEADAEQSTGASTEKAKPDVPILEIPKNSTAAMATMATGTTGIHKADIPPKEDLWDSGIDGNSIAWDCNDTD